MKIWELIIVILLLTRNFNISCKKEEVEKNSYKLINKREHIEISTKKFDIIIRDTDKPPIFVGTGEVPNNELLIRYKSTGKERVLVSSRKSNDPKYIIAGIHNPQLSIDKRKVFFMSSAWVVSDSIHVVEIKGKEERYICPGNYLKVIYNGKYMGYLIIQQHRYKSSMGGSYDHYYIIDEFGRKVKDLGEELPLEFKE